MVLLGDGELDNFKDGDIDKETLVLKDFVDVVESLDDGETVAVRDTVDDADPLGASLVTETDDV